MLCGAPVLGNQVPKFAACELPLVFRGGHIQPFDYFVGRFDDLSLQFLLLH